MAPDVPPPDLGSRAVALLDFFTRVAIAVAGSWAAMQGIVKPFMEFRRSQKEKQAAALAVTVRAILQPELTRLDAVVTRDETCAEGQERLFQRQKVLFEDVGQFLELASDNRERHDEQAVLLNVVFGLDRRVDLEERKRIDGILSTIRTRQKTRREEGNA